MVDELKLSDETNGYLKRKIEARDLEFEYVVCAKEQEIHGTVMRLNEMSAERDLKNDMLMKMEEKYKNLQESMKQVSD